jgi:hypothetical protein
MLGETAAGAFPARPLALAGVAAFFFAGSAVRLAAESTQQSRASGIDGTANGMHRAIEAPAHASMGLSPLVVLFPILFPSIKAWQCGSAVVR